MIASQAGCYEVVRVLLEKDAATDTRDSQNDTATTLAAKKGHTDIVNLIQKYQAGGK